MKLLKSIYNIFEPFILLFLISIFIIEFFNIFNLSINSSLSIGKSCTLFIVFLGSNYIIKKRKKSMLNYKNFNADDFIKMSNEKLAEIFYKIDFKVSKEIRNDLKSNDKKRWDELLQNIHRRKSFLNLIILAILIVLYYYLNSNEIHSFPFNNRSALSHGDYLFISIVFYIFFLARNIFYVVKFKNPNDDFSKYKK